MKAFKKTLSLLLCFALLASAMLLSACNEGETTTTKKKDDQTTALPDHMMYYHIAATDFFGNPMAGIKATIYRDGAEVKTVSLGSDGIERVALDKGDYTVTLLRDTNAAEKSYFGYDFTYDAATCVLSEEAPAFTAVLKQKTNGREKIYLHTEPSTSVLAPNVTGGAYDISLSPGDNYLVFRPSAPGIYEISIGDPTAEIAHLGSPDYFSDSPDAEFCSVNGVLTRKISRQYIGHDEASTSPNLIRITTTLSEKTTVTVTLKKVSEMPLSPSEVDWTEYKNPKKPQKFELPEDAVLTDVDVFDADLKIVFNESDGYYHVGNANGPVVLIRLTTDSAYLANFFVICNTDNLRAFFYDESGNFLRKETYNSLIHQYTGAPDINGGLVDGAGVQDPKTGTYPLDEHLAYFMMNAGETMGWWQEGHFNFRFEDDLAMGKTLTENAWLFACCYVAE